ncbi:tRNA lysidine(34) synthetase TilS [Arcobacteraceae bacterium]|nr:tRNA lysidine(34) synthetase TilS [Arcobacteraceae bacterium]
MNDIKLEITSTKNLLAFSAGIDSTALFFLLIDNDISFDIAIVDYNQRTQSKDEVIYATQLAHKYQKRCFISEYPKELAFSEKNARDYRYSFFDEIMKENSYGSLLTAHQLNDNLEWFLMQFTKGAGLSELLGMQKSTYKNGYYILKPLLDYSKNDLKAYLDQTTKKYFIDESNYDEKYKRNYFRHNFTDELLDNFQDGISKSFKYLELDNCSLFDGVVEDKVDNLTTFTFNGDINIAIRLIDKELKKRGIIISHKTRVEISEKKELVVSHLIAISIQENKIYMAPFLDNGMEKKFKNKCRINKIPKIIRPYLFTLYEKGLFSF